MSGGAGRFEIVPPQVEHLRSYLLSSNSYLKNESRRDGCRQPCLVSRLLQQRCLLRVGEKAALHQHGGGLHGLHQVYRGWHLSRLLFMLPVDGCVQRRLDGLRQLLCLSLPVPEGLCPPG